MTMSACSKTPFLQGIGLSKTMRARQAERQDRQIPLSVILDLRRLTYKHQASVRLVMIWLKICIFNCYCLVLAKPTFIGNSRWPCPSLCESYKFYFFYIQHIF